MGGRESKIQELRERKELLKQGGGPDSIAKQHAKGKLTARERIDLMVDPGTFVEIDLFARHSCTDLGMDGIEAPGDAVVIGYGKINGRSACLVSQDFTIHGGAVGLPHLDKIQKMIDMARNKRIPLVLINDSGGMRPQEQHAGLRGYCEIFRKHVITSGVVPQITLVMGPVAGGPCYGPALTDFIFMVKGTSHMFIGGPPVVKALIGESVTPEELGGARIHARISGVCDLACDSDKECISKAQELLGFLPSNNKESPPYVDTGDDPGRTDETLSEVVPAEFYKPYDMHQVIKRVFDNGYFLELKPDYAGNVITGYARLNGHSVAVIASQPAVLAGALDSNASDKVARFVRISDSFNVPIVNLIDTPAYVVGTKSEQSGIIRHGAKVLYAYAEATVPMITVVIRKGYAGAYVAQGSKYIGGDLLFAWAGAEFSIFGVDTGMSIIERGSWYKEQLTAAGDPEAFEKEIREEYQRKYIDIYNVRAYQHYDDIIEPGETRPTLIKALEVLSGKKVEEAWRKHGNMPV